MTEDLLGNKLKKLEQLEAGRYADPFLPIMARIDGKCFSNFTRSLKRPYDERFIRLMIATTKYLVEESEAILGYCQSDEITLYWYLDKENFSNREFWFRGKFQKLTSVLASTASSYFCGNLAHYLPEKTGNYPTFDTRVWSVPDLECVYENFLWRFKDARKNSVSMYARHFFSPNQLFKKSCEEMKEMLAVIRRPWGELPKFFTDGTYIKRQKFLLSPYDPRWNDVPSQYRPTKPVERTLVTVWEPEATVSLDWFTS
jgi:tRNA(His) 5'-end guanylyltransferase